MFTRIAIVLGLTLVLILPLGANAAEQAPFLITGGGQTVAGTEMQMGPGDTIAFVARATDEVEENGSVVPAVGQLQVVQRTATGGEQVRFHGEVTCVVDEMDGGDETGDVARFGGRERRDFNGDGLTGFVVTVVDSGDENRGTDEILFDPVAEREDPCEEEQMQDTRMVLARGNLKVDTASSGRG